MARLLTSREVEVVDQHRALDWWYRWWVTKAKVKHVLGFHTFVLLEDWDRFGGSIKTIGYICWLCDERQ